MIITEIRTGQARDGSRKAVLYANDQEEMPAGSLTLVSEFFRSKGLEVEAGYDGGHVLRLRKLESDEQLHDLVSKQFPEWIKTQANGLGVKKQPLVDDAITFVPLDRHGKQSFVWSRFSRQYATPMVGGLSFVSAGALLAHDTLSFRDPTTSPLKNVKNGISMASTVFFLGASALLTGLGYAAVRKPSSTELLKQLEPELDQTPEESKKKAHRNVFGRLRDYGLNNPWHAATLMNFVGVIVKSVSHFIPHEKSLRKSGMLVKEYSRDKMELGAMGASLISLGLIASAKPEADNSILGIKSYQQSAQAQDPLERRYHTISQSFLSPFSTANDQGKSGHLNMKAAGWLGMASNSLFGAKGALDVAAGFRHTDAFAKKQRNSWPLTLLVPFNLAADYLTTLSKPRYSYSLDGIASDAAEMIAHKLDMKTASSETITRQAYVLSELLAGHPRITQSAHQLREAIGARLAIDYGYKMPVEGEGLREYQHLLEISPFIAPKEKQPVIAATGPAPEADQAGHFVTRLQQQPVTIRSLGA